MTAKNMFEIYNPNPEQRNVGDCTVRAISKATGHSWEQTYIGLCLQGFMLGDMPSANAVWGAYLRSMGFRRAMAPDDITVAEFSEEYPQGTYILALSGHVVCISDGTIYDTWNSGNEIVLYYWQKG